MTFDHTATFKNRKGQTIETDHVHYVEFTLKEYFSGAEYIGSTGSRKPLRKAVLMGVIKDYFGEESAKRFESREEWMRRNQGLAIRLLVYLARPWKRIELKWTEMPRNKYAHYSYPV